MNVRLLLSGVVLTAAFLAGCGKSVDEKAADLRRGLLRADSLATVGQYLEANESLSQLQATATDLQNDTAGAEIQLIAGTCQRFLGEYDNALHSFQSAIEKFHAMAEKHRERKAHIRLAELYAALGRYEDGLGIAADARTEAKLFVDPADRYAALMTMATCLTGLQRYDELRDVFDELLSLPSPEKFGGSRDAIFHALVSSAVASGNELDIAVTVRRWVTVADAARDKTGAATALFEYGRWHQHQGRFDSAQAAFSDALQRVDAGSNPPLAASLWAAMGATALLQRQFENARVDFQNGLAGQHSNEPSGCALLLRLGKLATEWKLQPTSDTSTILPQVRGLADTCRRMFFPRAESFGWLLAGMIAERGNDQARAIEYYRRGYASWLALPRQIREDMDIAEAFLAAEGKEWTDPLVKIYAQQNAVDSLFAVVEGGTARDMAEFMLALSVVTKDKSLNAKIADVGWSARIAGAIEWDLDRVLREGDGERAVRFAALTSNLGTAESRLAQTMKALDAQNRSFGRILSPLPASLREVRAALPAGSAALSFIPTDNALYVLVTKNDTVVVRRSPVARSYFRSLVKDYLQLMGELRLNAYGLRLSEPVALQRINELSSVLNTIMISPVNADLRGVQKLYLDVPVQFSWLPVHTLRGDGGALGQRFNVSYLPTASALLMTGQPEHWTTTVLGLGYPGSTAWDVEYELKDIRSFFDKAGMLFDTSATLRRVADSTCDVLHCAAEFILDRTVPQNSHMVLSDGTNAHGNANIPLGLMAGISAPQALVFSNVAATPGQFDRYAPMLFLAMGTRTVIASMWQGDRRAKKLFGERFYTSLIGGSTATDAYGKAIQEMSKQPDANHVQRWGLYVQYGR